MNSNINCHCVLDGYRYPRKSEKLNTCSFLEGQKQPELTGNAHKRRSTGSVYDMRSDQDARVHLPALPATYWLETSSRFHGPSVLHVAVDKMDLTQQRSSVAAIVGSK